MNNLEGFKLWKIRMPLGRKIGDNMCYYEHLNICVVKLVDSTDNIGWGFGEKVADGYFAKEASWNQPMPTLKELEREFIKDYWPMMKGRTPDELLQGDLFKGDYCLKNALRYALWDLSSKSKGIPLYKLLNPESTANNKISYASACGYHQSDEWLCEFYKHKVFSQGYKAIKIKTGHPDADSDLRRLSVIRESIGENVEIAIDSNIAWDAKTTIERINYFQKNGIKLSYIEDPLAPTDLEGYRLLEKELDMKIAGHDYIPNPHDLRPLLDTGAIDFLRVIYGTDYGLVASELSKEYDIPMIVSNTFLEVGIHFAISNDRVNRIEFADLGWNDMIKEPVQIFDGHMFPLQKPGHGFEPKMELLEKWGID